MFLFGSLRICLKLLKNVKGLTLSIIRLKYSNQVAISFLTKTIKIFILNITIIKFSIFNTNLIKTQMHFSFYFQLAGFLKSPLNYPIFHHPQLPNHCFLRHQKHFHSALEPKTGACAKRPKTIEQKR